MKKSIDDIWESIHSKRAWGQYPSEDVIRFFAKNYGLESKDKIRVLDFGCGGGANTWYMAREGYKTYAFDGSISAVKRAKEKMQLEKLSNVEIQVNDALYLNYENDFFDAVVDSAVIYSNIYSDILEMYQNIYKILKFGGKLFSTGLFTKNTTGYGTGCFIENNTYTNIEVGPLAGRGRIHYFDEDSITNLLKNIGYINISVSYTRRWSALKEQNNTVLEYMSVEAEK